MVSRPKSTIDGSSIVKQASSLGSFCGELAQGFAAEERHILLELHRPAHPGFQRRMIRRDVARPGAIELFQAQAFDRAVAGVADAVRRAGLHQRVIDTGEGIHRHVQLPAQLADIGDAQGADRRAGDHELAVLAERECSIADIALGHGREHVARFRTHQAEHAIRRVTSISRASSRDVAADPAEIVGREAGSGDVEGVIQPRDREVAFDAAVRSASGINQAPRFHRHVVGADHDRPPRHPCRPSGTWRTRSGRSARRFAAGACSPPHGEPVLSSVGVDVDALGREPVRPLPTELPAEHRTWSFSRP